VPAQVRELLPQPPNGGVIILGRDSWASFIHGIKAGQFT